VEGANEAVVRNAEYFIRLSETDWSDELCGAARQQLQVQKANKPKLLPIASDISKLNEYLQKVQNKSMSVVCHEGVNDKEFSVAFRMLSESLLTTLVLFYRRRQGEVSKLKISQYQRVVAGKKLALSGDAVDSLSPLEQELCAHFIHMEIAGKRNNIVPILITGEQK
jgi:hypothetical protein